MTRGVYIRTKPAWNKGKTKSEDDRIAQPWLGKKREPDTIKKMSESSKGRIPWNKNIPHSEESNEKNRLAHIGKIPWNKNKMASDEAKKNMSIAKQGPKHNYWKGGTNGYWHGIARKVMSEHLGRALTSEEVVHHLDYDMTNNNIDNLKLFPDQGEHQRYHSMLRRFVMEEIHNGLQSQVLQCN